MAFITKYVDSIMPKAQPNPIDIGTALEALNAVDDPWARDVGAAFERIQDAITTVYKFLKVQIPTLTKFEFTDTTGRAACIIGYYVPGNQGATTPSLINFFSQITVANTPDPSSSAFALTIDPTNFVSIAPGVGAIPIVNLSSNGLSVAKSSVNSTAVFVHDSTTQTNIYSTRFEVILNNQSHLSEYGLNNITYDGNQIIGLRQTGPGTPSFASFANVQTWCQNLLTALQTHGLVT